jgi:hypothetical protein
MKIPTLVLATLTAATPALAKGTPDPKLPQPLSRFAGDWHTTTGQMTIDGKKHAVELAISCALAAGGAAIACEAHFDVEGMGHFEESDLFGYDAGQDRYHWFAVDQFGNTHDHVALPPADGQPIVFAYSGLVDGKPMHEVISFGFDRDGTKVDFHLDQIVAGKPAGRFTATMVKKS